MGRLRLIAIDPAAEPSGIKAAAYYRMSTEKQELSIELQQRAVEAYCASQGYRIIQTYADEGRSGLTLRGRPALQSLLEDVQRGPDYAVLVVYDVSRWGRFQETDESAYYDYLCRRAGVRVIYCAEPFAADPSPMGALMKSMKRIMAAEFSRELSTKIFRGQCRVAEMGFWVCGFAGYGLRRLLVASDGTPRRILELGDYKYARQDRVVLIPGPKKEVATVRRIFHLYVDKRMTKPVIADLLNREGLLTNLGRPWGAALVRRILANPNYAGHNVFNRTSKKLQTPTRINSPEHWVWRRNAFAPIIDPEFFEKTQRVILARSGDMTDEQIFAALWRLERTHGRLSEKLIATDDETPSVTTLRYKFGSLKAVYRRMGYLSEQECADLCATNGGRYRALRAQKKLVPFKVSRTVRVQTNPPHGRPSPASEPSKD